MKSKLMFIAAIGMLFTISSCEKDSKNPLDDAGVVPLGSYLTLVESINQNVDFSDATSSVSIKVTGVGSPVDKIDMLVVEGATLDVSAWKLIKSISYTGEGTELSTTNGEISAALGVPLQPGVQYTIYNRVTTVDGRVFDLINAGPNVEAPDFASVFQWTVNAVAPYTGNMAGDYKVNVDAWVDYAVGTILTGAVIDGPGANQITLNVYPNPDFGSPLDPIIVDIDPATGVATVPAVLYGDYGVLISCEGGGYVFSATGTVDLTLNHFEGTPDNSYGNYRLVIVKQ